MLALILLVLLLVAAASFYQARTGGGVYLLAGMLWTSGAVLILTACSTGQLLALPVL